MTQQKDNIYEPPGGILIWILIFLELLTFIVGIGVFLYQRSMSRELFLASQQQMNAGFGVVNTMVLLTGGFLMATAVFNIKKGRQRKSLYWTLGAALMGFVFLFIKGYEYYEKIQAGLTIDKNAFFKFYWLLTGFHFIHVLVGTVLLLIIAWGLSRGNYDQADHEDVETVGSFWHMCDLIWLLLFPVLYLLH